MVEAEEQAQKEMADTKVDLGEDVTPEERAAYENMSGMSDEEYRKWSAESFYKSYHDEILSEIP